MSICKYEENGKVYWRVYVHVRSAKHRKRRIQKYAIGLESESAARKEEKKLFEKAMREAHRLEELGYEWNDIVKKWYSEFKSTNYRNIQERSLEGYLNILEVWTKPWMEMKAAELTRADGRDLVYRMEAKGNSRAYIKKTKNLINKVFEWGIENRLIPAHHDSPVKGIILDKKEETTPDILTLEEIKKFLSAAQLMEHRWYPIWAMAVLTGMRSGELFALTWEQIDFEKGIITVDRSYCSNMGKTGPTKGRYWRTVPISTNLRQLLLDLKNLKGGVVPAGEYVLPRIKDWENGDQAVPLRGFLKSIGVRPVKFHALRACFATQMLANGVPAPIVMKIGGWKRTQTMDIYLRLAGVDVKGATECLNFMPTQLSFGDNVVSMFKRDG